MNLIAYILTCFIGGIGNLYIGEYVPPPPPVLGIYVSSLTGNDSNSGAYTNQAFATIAKVRQSISGSTNIFCQPGSHWREELSITNSNTGVYAWSNGVPPMFDASEVISGSWSNTTGAVWQKSLAWSNDTAFFSIWENSNRLPRASSVANCNSTAGSYFVANDTDNPIWVYVHATDGGNPQSNGEVYEYAQRGFGIDGRPYSGVTGTTIKGVSTRRNAHNNGSLQFQGSATGVTCYEGTKHNLLMAGSSFLTNVLALEAYYPAGGIMFVANQNTSADENVTFVNCSAIRTNSPTSPIDGWFAHINVSGGYGTMFHYGTKANGLVNAITAAGDNIVCNDGRFTNCTRAIFGLAETLTVTNSIFQVGLHALVQQAAASTNIFTGCLFQSSNDDQVWIRSEGGAGGFLIHSNVIQRGTFAMVATEVTSFFNVKSNIITSFGPYVMPATNRISSDYNSFGVGSTFFITGYGWAGNSGNFALWQSSSGQDSHSTNP